MEFEEILDATCEYGYPVRDIETFGGIHLIHKVALEDRGSIAMPEIVKKKSIRNIVTIRGVVITASAPFRRKNTNKRVIWDESIQDWKVVWDVWDSEDAYPSDLHPGDGIVYTSYKLGALRVDGLKEPLQFIREMDIDVTMRRSDMVRVSLTQKAMDCSLPYV